MDNKIKTLSIAAIILFIIAIFFKSILSIIVTNVIVEDIIKLQSIYNSNINVIDYFFNNYITMMKLEMVGLSIVMLVGCILLSTSLYLKIIRSRQIKPIFTKVIEIIFSIINLITIIAIILSLFTEIPYIYDVIRVGILIIIVMIILDLIKSFIIRSKSLKRTIYFALSITSVIALFFGVSIHFDNINIQIKNNNDIIEYHLNYIETYYKDSGLDNEILEELINEYMYPYYEMHSSKGYLIGLNYTTIGSYEYMIARDNEFSLTTDYTVEEKALYENYISSDLFNTPLLISLLGGLFAVGFSITLGEGTLASRKKKVKALLLELATYKEQVKNKEMSITDFNYKKQQLFDEL